MEIVLATGNLGKVRELQAMLAGTPYHLIAQSEFAVPEVAETGLSFVENALIKARHAAACTGRPALADDSGLACDALDGAPGIYSARYAGSGASEAANVAKLLLEMAPVLPAARGCRFICVMVYLAHAADPCPLIAQGVWEGRVTQAARGTGGFGYDPIFELPALGLTAAQLTGAQKQALSHRGLAVTELVRCLAARHARF